jgi:hypothetical protein
MLKNGIWFLFKFSSKHGHNSHSKKQTALGFQWSRNRFTNKGESNGHKKTKDPFGTWGLMVRMAGLLHPVINK